MQVCTLLQTDNHTSTQPFFTGRMPFLPPNQQCQSTEGKILLYYWANKMMMMMMCFVQSFVYRNNLYYQASPSDRPVQVTTSGDFLFVFNGIPDWLYEGYLTVTNE